MLPAALRIPQFRGLVDRQEYFVVHAPRQVGKTTTLAALTRALTREGTYAALLVSMEVGASFPGDLGAAELAVLGSWRADAAYALPPELQPPPWPEAPPGQRIGAALRAWAMASPRPLVLVLDEIDALQDEALVGVLRQIRDGYRRRPEQFPCSLALCGLRDVRDYRVAAGSEGRLGSASPFNIKARSLTLQGFTRQEVAALYAQHTADTGQVFTDDACERAFELTQGQPWLINALAREAVEELAIDPREAVTLAVIDAAKDELIRRQDTHLDSLAERLREDRVRRVIEPILAGEALPQISVDDLLYAQDLGLVRASAAGGLVIANPIYREVIPRSLASDEGRIAERTAAQSMTTPAGRAVQLVRA